jgi:hypothetical protein
MATTTEATDNMNDTMTEFSEKNLRLRCFEMSLQIKQQESMHRFQMWTQTGRNGEMPELHTMDEVFDHASSVYEFISTVE